MQKQLFAKAESIAQQLTAAIDNPDLPLELAKAKVDKGQSFTPLESVSFAIEAGADVSIWAFNAANDIDPLAIFGSAPAEAPKGVAWRPMLEAGEGTVWLRYAANCHLKLGAAASAYLAKFSVDSTASLSVATYMPHAKARGKYPSAAKAVAADLADLPHVFAADKVAGLGPDQVVTLELAGQLALSLRLDWADMLTGLSDPAYGLATTQVALAPKIDASASVKFALGLSGLFRIAFRGLPDGWVELQLLSDRQRQLSLGVSAGLDIAFADPDAAQAVLPEIAGELLGGDKQTLANWKDTITRLQDDLNQAHDDLVNSLSAPGSRLQTYLDDRGLRSKLQRLKAIEQKVTEALDQAPSSLQAAKDLAKDLDLTVAQAEALISKIEALPGKLKTLGSEQAEGLWEALGLPKAQGRLSYVLERMERLESIFARIAKAQLKLRFDYEYSRSEDNSALLAIQFAPGELADGVFEEIHRAALTLDAERILELAAAQGEAVRDGLLLGHRTDERRRAIGLTLGIDRWSASAKWRKLRREVTLYRQAVGDDKVVRHSLLGQRSFDGKTFFSDMSFAGEMAFGMLDYRVSGGPDGDWTTRLNLRWSRGYRKLGVEEIAEVLDYAELWSAVSEQHRPVFEQRLLDELKGKRVRARLEMSIDEAVFADPRFSARLRTDLDAIWAKALAGALSPVKDQPERATLRDRERLYAEVTPIFLDRRFFGLGAVPLNRLNQIRASMRATGASQNLINWELKGGTESAPMTWGTLQYLGRFARGFVRQWPDVEPALTSLASLSDWPVKAGLEKAEATVDTLDNGWDDPYSLRAFGRLMVLLHAEAGVTSGLSCKLLVDQLDKKGTVVASRLVLG